MTANLYFHPRLLARRAAEIAQSQRGRVERDACGRPFVRGADPLAEAANDSAAPPVDPGRLEWLIRVLRALTAPPPAPSRFHIRRVPRL